MKRIFVATIGAALIASPLFASAQAKNFEGFLCLINALVEATKHVLPSLT